MTNLEMFFKQVFEIGLEMRVPIVDIRDYTKFSVNIDRFGMVTTFTFNGEESIIQEFLRLAVHHQAVVVRNGNVFYMPCGLDLYILEAR